MALPLSGQFTYSLAFHRSPDGIWRGRAAKVEGASHPGLVGDRPRVELSKGVLRLVRTESVLSWVKPHYRGSGRPASEVAFEVGRLADALEDGDLLLVSRGGTTDLGIILVRHDVLVAGLGAVTGQFAPTINIEEDPRAHEEHLYHLKDALRDARTTVVWLEVGSPDVDGTIERLPHMTPGGRLVLAIAGESPEERRQLNNRAAGTGVIHKAASTTYVDVESRFRSEAKWRDYIEGLPSARPDDLYIRFTIGDTRIDLRKRQYAECPPWRLYASRVFRYGVPGEWSHVGIAHESLRMTQQGVIDAVELIASRRIGIRR